jgi:hypothetical protein
LAPYFVFSRGCAACSASRHILAGDQQIVLRCAFTSSPDCADMSFARARLNFAGLTSYHATRVSSQQCILRRECPCRRRMLMEGHREPDGDYVWPTPDWLDSSLVSGTVGVCRRLA